MTAGYQGPGPATGAALLTAWTFDPVAVVAVVAAGIAYLGGVRAVGRDGGRWPAVRTASFVAGLVLVVLVTCSALGVYAHVLFSVYVVQACLLLLVAPMLLGAGAPLSLAAAAAPPERRRRILHWTDSLPARVARLPGFGPAVLIAVTALLFFTPITSLALRHDVAGEGVRFGLLAAGLLVAVPVTDEHLSLSSLAYAAALGLAFVEFLLDALPGIVLRLQTHLLAADYWTALHRPWGPSPLADQHVGGAWLWFFGEAADLPFIAALLVAWVRSDAREARAVDRALDEQAMLAHAARELAAPDAGRAERADPRAGDPDFGDPDRQRPWWETDPSVFGDARARRNGWGAGRDG